MTVSTSTDDTFTDLATHEHPFERIVLPDDPERFIHVPTSTEKNAIELSPAIRYTLADLGIKVSTGPVVDFRLKEHLRDMPEPGAVPLLYPGHFSSSGATWPIEGMKKPNATDLKLMKYPSRDALIALGEWIMHQGELTQAKEFSHTETRRHGDTEKKRVIPGFRL